MRTRSSAAGASATDSAHLSSPPTARTARASKRRNTATVADTSSSDPPPNKRLKSTVALTAVNRQTVVDLTTLHTYLGYLIPIVNGGQAKGGVVAALTQLLPHHSLATTSSHHPHPIRLPSFNRLCGWLHTHNALCLFINVSPASALTASQYDNLFTRRGGRIYFQWFTPASVQSTHPLVHTLAAATNQSEVTVLLFCRRVTGSGSTSGGRAEGYRYYGRVGYVSHDAEVRPMQFVLELLDAKSVEAVLLHEQQQHQQLDPVAADSSGT